MRIVTQTDLFQPPPHPTCVETTTVVELNKGVRSFVCGLGCPPIASDLQASEEGVKMSTPQIPSFMRLVGGEDSDVYLECLHVDCPAETPASYGSSLLSDRPNFGFKELGGFIEFILRHAADHAEDAKG